MDYINILIATALLAVNFILNKYYQKEAGTSLAATLWYNVLCGVFTLVIFYFVAGFKINFTPFSLIITGVVSLCIGAYSMLGMKLIEMGKVAVYTLFVMLGGMILPLFYGLIYSNEEMNLFRWIGLALLIASIILSAKKDGSAKESNIINTESGKNRFYYIFLCIAVFVINGFVSIGSKIHQTEEVHAVVSEIDYVTLTGLGKMVFFGLPLLFHSFNQKGATKKVFKNKQTLVRLLIYTLLSASVVGISFILQLNSASKVPASALFPMITGGSIVFTAIASVIVFKEKLSKRETCGIVLCMLSTLLFL